MESKLYTYSKPQAGEFVTQIALTRLYLSFWQNNGGIVYKWRTSQKLSDDERILFKQFLYRCADCFIPTHANAILEDVNVSIDNILDELLGLNVNDL